MRETWRDPQRRDFSTIRAGTLDGALKPRVLGLAERLHGPSWLGALIEAGEARIAGEDDVLRGPVLVWRPWSATTRATFKAGAAGTYFIVGATPLANAIGHIPESREFGEVLARPVTAAQEVGGEERELTRAAFRGLRRELGTDGPAGRAAVEAYLRMILIEVYRAGRAQLEPDERAAPQHQIFSDFATLVEARFRERWTVEDYARALGVSRDRLGDICRRARGEGPKSMIDRRTALEARLHLENSANSIEGVAELLGFSTGAQFGRFFLRVTGQPPGAYRTAYLKGLQTSAAVMQQPFEWP